MAGEWAAHTLDGTTLRELEGGAVPQPGASPDLVAETKRAARDRLGGAGLDGLVAREGTTELVFFDALMALAATTDLRQVLDRFIELEYVVAYYRQRTDRPGLGQGVEVRMKMYERMADRQSSRVVVQVRRAIDNGDLTFASRDNEAESNEVVWSL